MKMVDEQNLRAATGPADAPAAAEQVFRAVADDRVTRPAPLGLDIDQVIAG